MELSLFAEAFSEMLARDYGEVILAALYHERRAPLLSRFCLVSGCSAGVPPPAAAAAPARARSRTFCSFWGARAVICCYASYDASDGAA